MTNKQTKSLTKANPTPRRRCHSQVATALHVMAHEHGVTGEQLQAITGWARKPSIYDLREMANRNGHKLVLGAPLHDGTRRFRVVR